MDEERREAFLQALQSLQEEQHEAERREKEERRYQEEQLKRDMEDARRKRLESEERERRQEEEERNKRKERTRGSIETDYGVEDARPGSSSKPRSVKSGSVNGSSKKSASSPTARSSAPAKATKAPPTFMARAGNVISNLRKLIESMAESFQTKPMFLMQMLAFIVGLLVVLSRRDVKERIKRIMGGGWQKLRQTAGMGVKVSYI